MTSIIGYTRVPFSTSASKNFSIAPVQQLCQNKSPFQDHQQQQQLCVLKDDSHNSNGNKNNTIRPAYHRMFSREMSQHGIIELIIDKRKHKENTTATKTNNRSIKDNKVMTIPNKEDSNITTTSTAISRRLSLQHKNSINYNILLSIDLSSAHDYDGLSSTIESTQESLQSLMDAISRIAQEKTIHFVQILNLLKKLQLQQEKHRFMSCIDKHSGKILVYFPNTISYTSVDQAYEWLKYTIDVDIDRFKHWQLSVVDSSVNGQELRANDNVVQPPPTTFDGENYFNDIHLFIDHIDSLIESDGLFSHHKNKKKKENQ